MPTSSLSSSSDSATCFGNGLKVKPSAKTSSYLSSYTAISEDREKKEKKLTEELSKTREEKFIANWQRRKGKKKNKNKEAESQLKTERKQNLKRKQEAWKLQVQKAKRQKVNPPNVQEEDDEKQQDVDEDDSSKSI